MIRAAIAVALAAGLGLFACREPAEEEEPPRPVHAVAFDPLVLPPEEGLPSEPGEQGVRDFLGAFLQIRVMGDATRARDFLSETSLDQYERHSKGLTLVAVSYTGWEVLTLEPEPGTDGVWKAHARLRSEDEPIEELLFVGPGPDLSGMERTWIVRRAGRL